MCLTRQRRNSRPLSLAAAMPPPALGRSVTVEMDPLLRRCCGLTKLRLQRQRKPGRSTTQAAPWLCGKTGRVMPTQQSASPYCFISRSFGVGRFAIMLGKFSEALRESHAAVTHPMAWILLFKRAMHVCTCLSRVLVRSLPHLWFPTIGDWSLSAMLCGSEC